jgi:two-component system chemotaxis response regulator CheB
MIKVLIVDDSPTARLAIRQALESDKDVHVVGEAESGAHALSMIARYNPDIITMDVYLKNENGIAVTSSIMASSPRPILIVTSINPTDPKLMYRAIEAGALDVVAKPAGPLSRHHDQDRAHLLRLVKALAKVPVVHRYGGAQPIGGEKRPVALRTNDSVARTPPVMASKVRPPRTKDPPQVVLIGASTGGPKVVSILLSEIPRPFPLPIVIIQHIPSGFSDGLAEWLCSVTKQKMIVVKQSTRIRPGEVYIAPDDHHLRFVSSRDVGPDKTCNDYLYIPSYDVLLESAGAYKISAIAIVMTGMGSDGTRGLQQARATMAVTVAQSPKSCVVDSMPGSAIQANVIDKILEPNQISEFLSSIKHTGAN